MAQRFLRLLNKHIPKTSRLHIIFNRNSVKVCYSCMPNVKSIISNHNRRVLKSNTTSFNQKTCNCHVKNECPLLGKCLTKSLVYNAEITTTDTHESKNYVGVTAGPFKERFNNHKKSLNPMYENKTELSNFRNTRGTSSDKTDHTTSDGQLSNVFRLTLLVDGRVTYAQRKK